MIPPRRRPTVTALTSTLPRVRVATDRAIGVPFVDLARVNAPLKDEILRRIGELIDRSEFGCGEAVARFESAFATATGRAACGGVASGLDAIRLALQAAGLEPGAEVLVPANTFVATFEAVSQAGGRPVPVDATLTDFNLDADAAAAAVTERTAFVLPVHLYGQLADMTAIGTLAERHRLGVLEDAAQAHGATRDDRSPGEGSLGAAYSFYPAKNLGAMGDAGAFASDDEGLVQRLRQLREHGQVRKYEHAEVGWTSRLDAFQAEVLSAKLPRLEAWTADRRRAASLYLELLDGVGDLRLPPVAPGSAPVWHLFVVRTAEPDALAAHLRDRGIATGRHYPQPPHLSGAYAYLGLGAGSFPVSEELARTALSLPIFGGMTDAEVEAVGEAVQSYFDGA
jgi:dTDP-4-amino-4,6-dideoxygalactose transaminase